MNKDILYKLAKYNNKLINENDKQNRIIYGEKVNQYINQLINNTNHQYGGAYDKVPDGTQVSAADYNKVVDVANGFDEMKKISMSEGDIKNQALVEINNTNAEVLVLSALIDDTIRPTAMEQLLDLGFYDTNEGFEEDFDDDDEEEEDGVEDVDFNPIGKIKNMQEKNVPSLMGVVQNLDDSIGPELAQALKLTSERFVKQSMNLKSKLQKNMKTKN